jgi:hypothetical protein
MKRGRPSSADLAIRDAAPLVEKLARPDAPYDLTDAQAAEWWAVVERLPADWFPRETHGMLAQYCRHIAASNNVARLIAEFEKSEDFDLDRYDKLLKIQEREGRVASSLATRMRLTQQTTYDKSVKKPMTVKRPWES